MKFPFKIGKYIVTEKLAEGGMAEIFRATYLGAGGFTKELVIKRILPQWSHNPDFKRMLVDEANALAHLEHQNIVSVFELGEDESGFLYIAMEFVDGVDLRGLTRKLELKSEKLPTKFSLYIASEILNSLVFAHDRCDKTGKPLNIVHRDISPSNILVSFTGAVKITDFGIAKGAHRSLETTTTQVKGKYAYMSPEQALGEALDPRTDIYSTGIVLYELATNTPLFEADNDLLTIENVKRGDIPNEPLNSLDPELPSIIKKALSKNTGARFQSAHEFLEAVQNYTALKNLNSNSNEFSKYLHVILEDEIKSSKTIADNADEILRHKSKFSTPHETRAVTTIADLYPRGLRGFYYKYMASPKVLAAAFAAMFIITASFFLYNGRIIPSQASADPTLPDSNNGVPGFMPKSKGAIAIDSFPPHTSGTIIINGKSERFATPFVLNNLSLDQKILGEVSIIKDGYHEIKETFVIEEDNPTFAKTYQLSPLGFGTINVHANPWGYVYIPNYVDGKETPVSNLKLRAGAHLVKIYNEPTKQWLTKNINISSDETINCTAVFGKTNSMGCNKK